MKIIISEAIPEDAVGIRKIQKETWLCTYPNEKLGVTKADIEEKVNELQAKGTESLVERIKNDESSKTYVARDGSEIVGYVAVQKTEDENKIRAIYVLAPYQGQGIGRSLMEKALEFMGSDKRISLEVVSYNTKAIEFYKRFGFVEDGEIVDETYHLASGKALPEIRMIKEPHDS
jgi:ribosomal protein S18 acetylase RimI-like enzyme